MTPPPEALTAREIAALGIPGVPTSRQNVTVRARVEDWPARPRVGRGGGVEYPVATLPAAIRAAVLRDCKDSALSAAETGASRAVEAPKKAPKDSAPRTEAAQARQDAKLAILAAWDAFFRRQSLPVDRAAHKFAGLYSAGEIVVEPWVRAAVDHVSRATLHRWREARETGDLDALAGRYRSEPASPWDGPLSKAKAFAVRLHLERPWLTAVQVRKTVAAEFGDPVEVVDPGTGEVTRHPLPSLRSLQRMLSGWSADNRQLEMSFSNPDGWKNKCMAAVGDASAGIVRLNQVWEIDASPTDVLTTDGGRRTIYALVDLYSRRLTILATATPRTEAVKLLLRRALLAWGVPEQIRTDNGSDFTSREAQRVLAQLGIETETSRPYSPWEKAFVERAIGTLNHSFFPLCPGYTGASVAERQRIRGRQPFSARLGETERDAFSVELSQAELQERVDRWVKHDYEQTGHPGLGKRTPADVAANWPQPVRRIEDARALDLLLIRTEDHAVTKKGIRIDGAWYFAEPLLDLMGTGERVMVARQPDDMGEVYVYRADPHDFLCIAKNMDRLGIARGEVAARARAVQKQRMTEARKAVRAAARPVKPGEAVDMVLKDAEARHAGAAEPNNVVPLRPASSSAAAGETKSPTATAHTSPALTAAAEAARAGEPPQPRALSPAEQATQDRIRADWRDQKTSDPVKESARDRFRRALALQRRIEAGDAVDDAEAKWLNRYRTTAEYRGQNRLYQDFGERMLAG